MRRRLPDILILALLLLLPLLLFWPQTLGGRTLLPTENLYQFEPFATYHEVVSAPVIPQNHLVSDLVLENYQWKQFIRQSIAQREIPLWNPYQFSGIPFMAAGQQSTLYPFSILYYILPLTVAYGWFTVVQLWLAGAFMYLFLRGLGIGRFGATVAGVTYQLSAFFVISAVFPMIIAAAAWLPLLLLMIEFTIRQRPLFGRPTSAPWAVIGAAALGCNILAGHVEITYYTLLIMGYYAAARLFIHWWKTPPPTPRPASMEAEKKPIIEILRPSLWLVGMVVLGLALGAVQFIPLFEFASLNFRSGSASYEQVIGWAHPLRDIAQFALPNVYGNPAHHAYVDVFTRETVPATVNALGQPINTIDWGIKNYVEGALYVGILPLVLAAYAVVNAIHHRRGKSQARPQTIIFLLLALLGLTFMFGLPTYRLLYLLPGIDQLHSPFRWIYAVTLSVAVLAGVGAHQLANREAVRVRKWFEVGLLAGGALILLGLLASYVTFPQIEPLIDRVLRSLALADHAFADARMFYSYQFTNILTLGVMLLLSGTVFWWANRVTSVGADTRVRPMSPAFWQIFAVGLVAIDLMIASWGFNPASDPLLLDFVPPAIQWLQDQPGDWRYTTLDDPTQRPIMNANIGWQYGLRDIRGYESIIPKHYVDYMAQIAPQTQLDFNRVAPLYTDYGNDFDYVEALESPLLDLLNVRYVITHKSTTLPEELTTPRGPRTGPKWSLAYEDEAVRIWSNGGGGGRAALLSDVEDNIYGPWAARITQDSGRERYIELRADEPVWLRISETYMPGWRAFIRPWGSDEEAEQPLDVQMVNDVLQGVNLDNIDALINQAIENGTAPQTMVLNAIETAINANDADQVEALINDLDALVATEPPEIFGNINGRIAESMAQWRLSSNRNLEQRAFESQLLQLRQANWTVRMVYSPASFQVGLFVSFIGAVLIVFMLGVWLWRLFIASDDDNTVSRVARNSLAPIILNLFNRGIDFAFAFVMLRILGPADAGIYFYAGFIFIWFDIFTNFGLDVFLTREVARDPSRAGRYFFTTSALRLSLTLVGVILLAAFLLARQSFIAPPLSAEGVIAIILLYIGLLPGSLSKGMTSLFYAFQQAEYPAAITTLSTISKVILGLMALVLGYGVVGLAAASIVTNVLTLVILMWGGRGLIGQWQWPDLGLARLMSRESWPLMVNHFLATIFFQIDILIIEALHGVRMVGLYSVAYKWVAALNIIPAFFTQAMLPVMSQQAHEDRDALKRTYILAVKLLVSLALPVAVSFTVLAWSLTALLGGSQYLPDGAIATQLMIWSIPIGWINSLTQYVLIALDLQRRIMGAFAIAVGFNIVANLLLIPQYGYQAAALTTIASEMMLLLPFGWLMHGALGAINWGEIMWRPGVATAAMLGVVLLGASQPVIALVAGVVIYATVLLMLRPFTTAEIDRLLPLLPPRLRNIALVRR